MRTRSLLLPLVSLALACSAEPATGPFRSTLAPGLKPGESGTLVQVNESVTIDALAVSANYLYLVIPWHGIYRMPKYGGEITPVDLTIRGGIGEIAVESDRPYWENITFNGDGSPHIQIRTQSADGSGTTTIYEGNSRGARGSTPDFQVAGDHVYWNADVEIAHVSIGTGRRETALDLQGQVAAWAVDAGGLYVTTTDVSLLRSPGECRVRQLPGPGETPRDVGPCPTQDSFVVAVDADAIYLQSAHSIWRILKADGSATALVTLADDAYFAWGTVADATSVYTTVQGSLVMIPKTGGPLTTVADSSVCPNLGGSSDTIAVDVAYVYLACDAFQRVVIVPKPAP